MERALLAWFDEHGRDLPWRRTHDPYAVLVSEVMLQQTQVARVVPRFIAWLELCRWIRSGSHLPVIMLTARGEESDRIIGLELGADDYVTKPFSPRELAARVRTVLRRSEPAGAAEERLAFDGLVIDAATHEVTKNGTSLRLTAREFQLLWFLASHPERVFSREQLMRRVWGYSAALDTGTVTVHVRRLREKIEDEPSRPQHLETVWGVGYRFTP